ncbi:oligosaccharide flippase family protein [Alteromonas genovensis]|uniref:Oligosaccharide flippase family protein n=1 Tax=Alteromonas genovensis TaxID=471225 RepID=A0A6N9TAF8_9ALTE|nr:oligosaccharide flippase family protein [Alteromonas genovensis]NDW14287.1 oligosaccharide flippase family protein [Alteromonas genovensis]
MLNANKLINSAFFSVAAKLLGKTLGLISTVIVARILTPEDFGFIAIVSMALYFFDILSHAAGEQYIIQKGRVAFYDLHTAWTLNLVLKVLIAIGLVISAGSVSLFFDKPQLSSAIMFSATILPLQALKSHKIMLLKRQLRFKPLFWLSFLERVFALPVLITLAILLGNYWAFLITDVMVAMFGLLLSFFMLKGMPRLTLRCVGKQWRFSQWMLGKHLLGYARSQIDTLVVAKVFNASMLGNYHMARDLAMMPAHYLLSPAIEPLLAVLKNDRANKRELLNNVAFALLVVVSISLPIVAVLMLYSKPIVYVLLGEKWHLAAQLLPVLSILFFYWCIVQVLDAALIALDKVQFLFLFDVASLAVVGLTLLMAIFYSATLLELAWYRALSGLFTACVLLIWVFIRHWNLLKALLKLVAIVIALTGLALGTVWLTGFNEFSRVSVSVSYVLQTGASLAVFSAIYTALFLLFLTKSKHYHIVRLKQLVSQYLPTSLTRKF